MADRKFGIETLCLHAGQIPDAATGRARRADLPDHLVRLRLRGPRGEPVQPADVRQRLLAHLNPTVAVFEERMAAVEGGRAGLAAATGQAAEVTAILTLCSAGDHIVSASTLYGGTHTLLHVNLKKLGIETTFVAPDEPENFRKAIQKNTKLIYAETLGNPLTNIVDIEALAAIAHDAGIPLLLDNTVPIALSMPADRMGRRNRRALGHQVHRRPRHHHGRGDRRVRQVRLGQRQISRVHVAFARLPWRHLP